MLDEINDIIALLKDRREKWPEEYRPLFCDKMHEAIRRIEFIDEIDGNLAEEVG